MDSKIWLFHNMIYNNEFTNIDKQSKLYGLVYAVILDLNAQSADLAARSKKISAMYSGNQIKNMEQQFLGVLTGNFGLSVDS